MDADQPELCDIQVVPCSFPGHFRTSVTATFDHPSADIYRADLESSNDPIFKLVLGKDLLLSFSFPKSDRGQQPRERTRPSPAMD